MKYCKFCGCEQNDSDKFCQECGAPVDEMVSEQQGPGDSSNLVQTPYGPKNKDHALTVFAYFGLLALIPILKNKNKDEFCCFHINQGLSFSIITIVCNIIINFASMFFDGFFRASICFGIGIFQLIVFCWGIAGAYDALKGNIKPRGLLNRYQFIK